MSKIVFIGPLSNVEIREKLDLKSYFLRNKIFSFFGRKERHYYDVAPWVFNYIKYFEKDQENEYFIISLHRGLKKRQQSFFLNGVNYCILRGDYPLYLSILNRIFRIAEKKNYARERKYIKRNIDYIQPDLVVVCGAENPHYSLSSLDINDCPVMVILQTLLNSPKRIEMNVGSSYRRIIEKKILSSLRYYGSSSNTNKQFIQSINPSAIVCKVEFPATNPPIILCVKEYDFVMNARTLTKFKGVEDTVKAFIKVVKLYPKATLRLIGAIEKETRLVLHNIIQENGIESNVTFSGRYERVEDMYIEVQKARYMVLPGITSAFNTTIREGMLMKMPVIMYETSVSRSINNTIECLLCAKMQDVQDLASRMIYAIEHPESMRRLADNAYQYAKSHFDSIPVTKNMVECFKAIIANATKGEKIPNKLLKFSENES